jgi:hypothetical protein
MMTIEHGEALGTLIAVIIATILNRLDAMRATKARDALTASVVVSDANKTQALSQIHTLVNSGAGNTLRMILALTQRIAEFTQHPDDLKAADLAAQAYDRHTEQANKVDSAQAAFKEVAQAASAIPKAVDLSTSHIPLAPLIVPDPTMSKADTDFILKANTISAPNEKTTAPNP